MSEMYRTQVRIPSDIAAKIKEKAKANDRTFNGELVARLRDSLRKEDVREAA